MKRKLKAFATGCFALLAALVMVPAAKADAASVEQTGATKTSVSVKWEAEEDATKYHVYLGKTDENYNTTYSLYKSLPATQTKITVSDLSAGTEYKVRVEYDCLSYDGTSTNTYSVGTVYDAKTLPGKVTGVKQSQWWYYIETFDVTWNKQSGVDGYDYIVYKSNGKKFKSGSISYASSNRAEVRDVSNSMVYTVKVRAFSTINGKKYTGEWSSKCYCFTQPRITKLSQSSGKLTIKWKKVSGATGYDVYVSTKPTKSYKKVKSVGKNTSSVTIKKLSGKKISAKKNYYVYVVSKKKVGSKTYKCGKLYYWNSKKGAGSNYYFD